MKDSVAHLLATLAYSGAIAASATDQISEPVAAIYAVSGGLFGGFVASIMGSAQVTGRAMAVKIISSGLLAPILALLILNYAKLPFTVFPVVAASGMGGLLAWPIASLAHGGISQFSHKEIADLIRKVIKRVFG